MASEDNHIPAEIGHMAGVATLQHQSKAPSVCECVSHGQSVPLCWMRGGTVRGEEANGRTHLLSPLLLLLLLAIADIGAERDTKQPPPGRERGGGNRRKARHLDRKR